jgi:hypothetical protein
MSAKLIAGNGEIIFEFESEAFMRAMLLKLVSQSKYGEDLRAELTLNPSVNALARAILIHAEKVGARDYKNANGYYPSPPEGVTWYPRPKWMHAVDRLIFDQAPNLRWWTLSRSEKEEIVERAFFPHRLSEEAIADSIDPIDFWVRKYRKD